jgi:hypothetical protein
MIEYTCKECDEREFQFEVIPCKKCPGCGKYMEAIEE